MPLFCLIVSPLILLIIGEMLGMLQQLRREKLFKIFFTLFMLFFVVVIFNLGRIENIHTDRNPGDVYRNARIVNKAQFEKAAAVLPSKDIVIFNCGGQANGVACMFYTGFTSYSGIPNEDQLLLLKSKGIKIAVFDDIPLPDHIAKDESIIKLHFTLIRNGF